MYPSQVRLAPKKARNCACRYPWNESTVFSMPNMCAMTRSWSNSFPVEAWIGPGTAQQHSSWPTGFLAEVAFSRL